MDQKQIFEDAIKDFESTLTEKQLERLAHFKYTTVNDVKQQILKIQNDQSRRKSMINFTRYYLFILATEQLDEVCKALEVGIPDLSGYLWGPCRWILQMIKEDEKFLDPILGGYLQLGQKLPLLEQYKAQIRSQPDLCKFLAWMYDTIMRFHGKVLQLLAPISWKKTFLVNWEDYGNSFKILLQDTDKQANAIQRILESQVNQEAQNSQRRLNDHILRYRDDQEDNSWNSQAIQQQLSTLVTQASDSQRRQNDYYMQYQEDREDGVRQFEVTNDQLNTLVIQSSDSQRRQNDHYLQYQGDREDIQHHISQYQSDRVELLVMAKKQEAQRQEDRRNKVLGWLSSPEDADSHADYHKIFQKTRDNYHETGNWIFHQRKIRDWMSMGIPAYSILWAHGKKGAGKTILTSRIISVLSEQREDFKTSYFYCREASGSHRDTHSIACLTIYKSLLRQMLRHNRDLLPTLYQKMENGTDKLNDEGMAKSLIELFFDTSMRQFIVIDGLDELGKDDRQNIVNFLKNAVGRSNTDEPGKIRILLTSRNVSDMTLILQSDDNSDIYEFPSQKITEDILHFVDVKLNDITRVFELNDAETHRIRDHIRTNCEGVFLYAFLVIDNLQQQLNIEDLLEELEERRLPKGLSEAYDRIIQRLRTKASRGKIWDKTKRIFGSLACAKRPLKLHELQAIMSMDVTDGKLKIDLRNRRLRTDVLDICGSLIHIVGGSRIEFIHQTAKEYIMENQTIDRNGLECDLTLLCLCYLSDPAFSSTVDNSERTVFVHKGTYIFQDYAASMWNIHLKTLIEDCADLIGNRTMPIYQKVNKVLREFYNTYKGDIDLAATQEEKNDSISEAKTKCVAFQGQEFFTPLTEIWAHVIRHQNKAIKERVQVSLKELKETLEKNRAMILAVTSDVNQTQRGEPGELSDYYGSKHHKCTRVNCIFFYEGFEDEKSLKNHSNRHERPFSCPVPDCTVVPFGFPFNKDRDKHIRTYHPERSDQPYAFPRIVSRQAKHACTLCDKSFTRAAILRHHMDGIHLGRRPYACSVCEREFTRSSDRRRHERTRHVRRA